MANQFKEHLTCNSSSVRNGAFSFCILISVVVLCLITYIVTSDNSYFLRPLTFPKPRRRDAVVNKSQVYLCITLQGRLGNALFVYASALGLGVANNMTLVLKDNSVLPGVLKHPPAHDLDFDLKCFGAYQLLEKKCCAFDESLTSLRHDDYYILNRPCLISWKYFENIKESIKTLLSFRDDVMAEAKFVIRNLRSRWNCTLVGIHVRRDDHTGLVAYWAGHKPVTADYLHRAMTYFRNRFVDLHFVVTSDDSAWCQEHIANGRNDVTILNPNPAAVDLLILSMTDHMIISVGTYGWWAGYLNPGIKVYMKDFIVPGSNFAKVFSSLNAPDYFYPEWIPL